MIELSRVAMLNDYGSVAEDGTSERSRVVIHSQAFRRLMSIKRRTSAPLLGVGLAYAFGVALLSGFAPELMARKVAGSFTLGYLLVAMIYVMCWVLSVAYVVLANRMFDVQAELVADAFRGDA